jgi:hypothetical protein
VGVDVVRARGSALWLHDPAAPVVDIPGVGRLAEFVDERGQVQYVVVVPGGDGTNGPVEPPAHEHLGPLPRELRRKLATTTREQQ